MKTLGPNPSSNRSPNGTLAQAKGYAREHAKDGESQQANLVRNSDLATRPSLSISPRAILLDVDGTLIESNMQHAEAWFAAFREAGYEPAFEAVRKSIGKGGDQLLPSVVGLDPESDKAKQLSRRRGEIFRTKFLHQLSPHLRSAELLKAMVEKGYELVIATSSEAHDLEAMLRQTGLDGIIPQRTTASDSKKSKPHPDIILAALAKVNCEPQMAVMIGDTPFDIEAARRAGVPAIGFASGGWSHSELEAAGAIAVFDGPADFLSCADQVIGNWNEKKRGKYGEHE